MLVRRMPSLPTSRSALLRSGMQALALLPFFAATHFHAAGLGGSDPWRHIQWAYLSRASPPGALREFPVFTLLQSRGVDLWELYHLLLWPFTFGDLERGARIAATCFAVLSFWAIGFVFTRLRPERSTAALFALAAFSPVLVARAVLARPAILVVALTVLAAWALVERRPRLVLLFAFLHAALHVSVPLQGLAVVAAIAADLWTSRRVPWRLCGHWGLGCALGIFLRPRPLDYLVVALAQGLLPFKAIAAGFPDLGIELYPPNAFLLLITLPAHLLLAWTLLGTVRAARGGKLERTEVLLSVLALESFVVCLRARRFLEIEAALVALYACSCWRPPFLPPAWVRFARPLGAMAIALGLAASLLWTASAMGRPFASTSLTGAAAALRAHLPQGALIFHDDWRSWPKLFFEDPTHRYVVGADPTLMSALDPHRFWLWYHLGHHGLVCDAASAEPSACAQREPDGPALSEALREFGAAAVLVSDARARPRLAAALDRAPDRFERIYRGVDGDRAVLVYAVR